VFQFFRNGICGGDEELFQYLRNFKHLESDWRLVSFDGAENRLCRPLTVGTLGDSESFLGRGDDQPDSDPELGEQIDQGVDAEQIDSPSNQVADPGLSDAKNFGCFCLLETPGGEHLLELDEKVSSHPEVFGLLLGEAQISEDITGGSSHLQLHSPLERELLQHKGTFVQKQHLDSHPGGV